MTGILKANVHLPPKLAELKASLYAEHCMGLHQAGCLQVPVPPGDPDQKPEPQASQLCPSSPRLSPLWLTQELAVVL